MQVLGEQQLRRDALAIWEAALHAANPRRAVRRHLLAHPITAAVRRLQLLSVGKAAVRMAQGVADVLGDRLSGGLVVALEDASVPKPLRAMQSSHPIPSAAGLAATSAVEAMLHGLAAEDLLILALSGGASAMLPAPVAAISLEDKQRTTELLLAAGASIAEMNTVRKHLSRLKGGGLARRVYPAQVRALLLSDVVGDDLTVIGSGPCAADPTTFGDALSVLERLGVRQKLPGSVDRYLQRGLAGLEAETPKPDDPALSNVESYVVASNRISLRRGLRRARALGYRSRILTASLTGEARTVGAALAALLREARNTGRPTCLLSGGETTVRVIGTGRGGRNQELALSAALELQGCVSVLLLSAGTDGIDGPTDAAGAIATGSTIEDGTAAGIDGRAALDNNDAYGFFSRLDLAGSNGLIQTGVTGTNVMDIQVLLANPSVLT